MHMCQLDAWVYFVENMYHRLRTQNIEEKGQEKPKYKLVLDNRSRGLDLLLQSSNISRTYKCNLLLQIVYLELQIEL